ncbi:hypothetical protein EV182_007110, partial [Spiromyces aspiralis]
MALVLRQVFLTDNPFYVLAMTTALSMMAAYEVTYWRSNQRFKYMYLVILASILFSTMLIGLIGEYQANLICTRGLYDFPFKRLR